MANFDELWDATPAASASGSPSSFDALWDSTPAMGPKKLSSDEEEAGNWLNILNAMTLGFGDEIVGGGNALIDSLMGQDSIGNAYDSRLKQARELRQGFREENPGLSMVQDVAGGAMLPAGKLVSEAKGFVPKVGAAALEGAGFGGAYGFGEGQGVENRLEQALLGGAFGGAGGAVLGGGAVAGGKLLDVLGGAGSKFFPNVQADAARALKDADTNAIRSLIEDVDDPLFKFKTLSEATQSPGLAQLEQEIGKAPGKYNTLAVENERARRVAQNELLRSLSSEVPTSKDNAGAMLRDSLLRPMANDAFDEAQKVYGKIDQEGLIPVDSARRLISRAVKEEYKAGGIPGQLQSIVGEINKKVKFGDVEGLPKIQTHAYMQDLRERAQQAFVDLKNVGDAKGARVANKVLREIDGAIERGPPGDVPLFREGKRLYSEAMDTYADGRVGDVLRKQPNQAYTVEDFTVVDKLWTGTPEGTENLLRALPKDAASLEKARGALRDKIIYDVSDRNENIQWTKFHDFLKRNKEALTTEYKGTRLFSDDHIHALQRVADDLEVMSPSSVKSVKSLAYQASKGQPTTGQALMMAADSKLVKLIPFKLGNLIELANENHAQKVRDMVAEAMFDKGFAQRLNETASSSSFSNLLSRLGSATVGAAPQIAKVAGISGGLLAGALLEGNPESVPSKTSGPQSYESAIGPNEDRVSRSLFDALNSAYLEAPPRGLQGTQLQEALKGQTQSSSPNYRQQSFPTQGESTDMYNPVKWQGKEVPFENLVQAVVQVESAGNAKAEGPKTKYGTAKGAMQILDSTAKWALEKMGRNPEEWNPYDEQMNKEVGSWYLQYLVEKFEEPRLALAAYNWGEGNLQRLIKKLDTKDFDKLRSHLPKETRLYVPKVEKNLAIEV